MSFLLIYFVLQVFHYMVFIFYSFKNWVNDGSPLQRRQLPKSWGLWLFDIAITFTWWMWSLDLDNEMYMKMMFATNCSQLVNIVSAPMEWPAFVPLLEEIEQCKTFFPQFSLQHNPRTKNTMTNKLTELLKVLFQLCTMFVILLQFRLSNWLPLSTRFLLVFFFWKQNCKSLKT